MTTVKRFTNKRCGPCRTLAPIIEQLQREVSGVMFEIIDTDSNPDLIMKYNISSVPTLVFEKDGQEIKRTLGVQSKATLISILNSI